MLDFPGAEGGCCHGTGALSPAAEYSGIVRGGKGATGLRQPVVRLPGGAIVDKVSGASETIGPSRGQETYGVDMLDFLRNPLADNTLQDWLIAAGVFLVMMVVVRAVIGIGLKRVRAIAAKTETDVEDLVTELLEKTKFLFVALVTLYAGAQANSAGRGRRPPLDDPGAGFSDTGGVLGQRDGQLYPRNLGTGEV